MKRFQNRLLLATLATGGAALALQAIAFPAGFGKTASLVAVLAYGVMGVVLAGSLRGEARGRAGVLPLLAGLAALASCAALGLLPAIPTPLPATTFHLLLEAIGALGLAAGLVTWGHGTVRRALEAETREHELRSRVSELEQLVRVRDRELQEARTTDEATGILNRRSFLVHMEEVLQRDSRLRKPVAFILVQVVDYRALDAERWQGRGEHMINAVAKAVLTSTRGTDHAGRIADDQIAAVLGECESPRPAVDRLFLALQEEAPPGQEGGAIRVRVGSVSVPDPSFGATPNDLFRLANEALASLRGAPVSLCAHRTLEARRPRAVRPA